MQEWMAGIEPEKRNRILNAAIEEFAMFPYEKASTNHIVSKAGISKGLLFHYFGSKQELYEQLIGFVIEKMFRSITEQIDWQESDLFERLKQIALIKIEVSQTYPHFFNFLLKLMSGKQLTKAADMIEFYKNYGWDFQQISIDVYTRNVDYTRFRDPKTTAEAINIVRWSLEKFVEELLQQLEPGQTLDMVEAAGKMGHYMDFLKQTFYRPEQKSGGQADDQC